MKLTNHVGIIVFSLTAAALAQDKLKTCPQAGSDFAPIFDGKTLKGWHISSKCGHGTTKAWVARDGAITGTQDKPGNGGILLTDEPYSDFEISMEMGNDYGPDSGLFLRSTEEGKCYQAMIDYHNDGNVMGVYGEGIGGFVARSFQTLESPDKIKLLDYPKFPCPVTPEQWKTFWKKDWNKVQARITGNPPRVETWINGVKFMDWTDTEKRLPDKGSVGVQVHGGGDLTDKFVRYRNIRIRRLDTPDNSLSPEEKAAGWQLLFDGKTLKGWKTCTMQESKVPVDDGCIQPHGCGAYMMVPEREYDDFILSLDFKISKKCNSGIFVRTYPIEVKPGEDVGYNGIEMAVDDTTGAGMHDTGALYDLVAPCRNAMKPVGEWNHAVITCDGPMINVELNGEQVTKMNLDEWTQKSKRPDGSIHKFNRTTWKDHPRHGYIGLQDHGSPCWYKNIKLLPLHPRRAG
jgi:3-keto-disaccharide hydrolase